MRVRPDLATNQRVEHHQANGPSDEQQKLERAEGEGNDGADKNVGEGAVAAVDSGVVCRGRLGAVDDGGGGGTDGGRHATQRDDHLVKVKRFWSRSR